MLAIEHNRYVIRERNGQERVISIHEHSRRDGAIPGDEVRVFTTKDG